MRYTLPLLLSGGLIVSAGCGSEAQTTVAQASGKQPAAGASDSPTAKPGSPTTVVVNKGPATDRSTPVKDLGTRKFGHDWPAFLGPTGDSRSGETGIVTDWSNGLKVLWHRELGLSYGMPTISRGRLFQFDGLPGRARLVCMESETGKELWHFDYASDYQDLYRYENGPRCSPVVDDDRVYIYGAEGMLHCLDVRDGSLVWKLDTIARFNVIQNFFGVGSTPVIEGDLLIVQVGGSPEANKDLPPGRLDLVRGNGSGIVAFDKRSGEVKYQITDELASYSGPTLATIAGRRWCFVFARGGLVGFDPATGKVDFQYPWRADDLESVNASKPVVVGDLVFISETYGPGSSLLRVRPGGYDVVWKDSANIRDPKSLQTHWNTPIHHEGYLYASSGRHTSQAELRCIELSTGKVQWSEPGLTLSSLLYADGHLICLTEVGDLILLRPNHEKYDEVGRVRLIDFKADEELLKYPCWAAPILSHGLLYVRGKDRLVCVELSNSGQRPQGGGQDRKAPSEGGAP
jgi:outer membrane protein assembly factor BamB